MGPCRSLVLLDVGLGGLIDVGARAAAASSLGAKVDKEDAVRLSGPRRRSTEGCISHWTLLHDQRSILQAIRSVLVTFLSVWSIDVSRMIVTAIQSSHLSAEPLWYE